MHFCMDSGLNHAPPDVDAVGVTEQQGRVRVLREDIDI